MKDWLEICGVVLACIALAALGVFGVLLILALYGAIFGAIGAGAYIAFKWLVALSSEERRMIHWPNVPVVAFEEGFFDADPAAFVERLEAAKPPPEVPPPCWDNRPVDPEACHAATRAMCA